MRSARRILMGGLGIWALLLSTGCTPGDPKDMQIQSLQEQLAAREREIEEWKRKYAQAISERDEARARAAAAESQLRNAMANMGGERPAAPSRSGDFIESGPFAYAEVSEEILFDSGKADLKSSGKQKLQDIAQQIQQRYAGSTILVVGHTDTDPIKRSGWKDNLDLSVNRGATVVRTLYGMGINAPQLIAAGQGEYNPIAPNDSRGNKAKNRRVQIIAAPPIKATAEPAGGGNASAPQVDDAISIRSLNGTN